MRTIVLMLGLLACTGPTGSPEPAATPTPDAPVSNEGAEPAPDAASPPVAAEAGYTAVVEGTGCEGRGQVAQATLDDIQRGADAWTITRSFGCGCPTERPEFTLVYQTGATAEDPARVWLCHDDGADPCEALCENRVLRFDTPTPLEAANAIVINPPG